MSNSTIIQKAWIFPGILYLFLSILEVIAVSTGLDDIHFVVKPMLMPMLAATALIMFKAKSAPKAIIGFLLAALVFHTAGDIFLLFDGGKVFIYGLLAFLVGHLFYIFILGSNIRENTMKENPISLTRMVVYTTFCILLPIAVAMTVTGISKALSVYVGLYAWILTSMAYLSGRCAVLKLDGGKFVLTGALLFIVSDSVLAMNQFLNISFPFRHGLVMLTYTLAQAFLVYGIGKFYNVQRNLK